MWGAEQLASYRASKQPQRAVKAELIYIWCCSGPKDDRIVDRCDNFHLVRMRNELNGAFMLPPQSPPQNLSRQLSLSMTMQAIVHCGPISRASIAKQTGLSKQTISETVRILTEDGWISEIGRTSGHIGRTATTYELVPDAAYVAAIDLGGTKLRVAIIDLIGNILSEKLEPTDPAGGAAVAKQIVRLCRSAAADKQLDFARVRQTVVGCPGVPDRRTGAVHFAPNIAGLDTMDFRAVIARESGTEVMLENDVNLAVIGEHWLGCGKGLDQLAYVALGTGVGAGLIVNGEILRGAMGAAGELGYLPFGADPFEPESLRVGAMERVVGTLGIRAGYKGRTGQELDVPSIFSAAKAGDADAIAVLQTVTRTLARAVAAIAAVTNPDVIILGGSIGARAEVLRDVRAELAACFPHPVRVETTVLGNHASLAGAVAVGLTELHTALFANGAPGAQVALPEPDVLHYRMASQ